MRLRRPVSPLLIDFPLKLTLFALALIAAGILWQKEQLTVLALSRIDPVIETKAMVAEGDYAEAANYLGFFMGYDYVRGDPRAAALYAEITAKRDSLGYQAHELGEGLLDATSDETIGQAAGLITDLLVIGDVRDLAGEAKHLAAGEEVDEVIVALATIGVVASAAQVVSVATTLGTGGAAAPTVGATTSAKCSIGVLKVARKLDKLPPWLGQSLLNSAATVKTTQRLDGISDLLSDVYQLGSTRGGLRLLSETTSAASLRNMVALTETFGDQTATLYRIGGPALVKTAARAGQLGTDNIKLATTYGQSGIKVLDRIGAAKFAKLSARASKIGNKGDLFRILARWLIRLPQWLLFVVIGLGAIVWMPWSRLGTLVWRR